MKHAPENKEILIIQNITREGPGLLGEIIAESGIRSRVLDLSQGEKLPPIEGLAAVIVLGGPDSANDKSPAMLNELDFIRKVLSANIPYLGICLGMQTLVKAAGGEVVKSPAKETGFRDPDGHLFRISLTDEGRKDPLFKGIGDSFNVFHLHGETVVLTDKMKLLATGNLCLNQIVKTGRWAYGIQCHFELTSAMMERWINEDPDLQLADRNELHNDFSALSEQYLKTGDTLFRNFLGLAGFCV